MEILTKLNKERGVTLLLITHDSLVARYAKRTVRLIDGKIMG